MVQALRDRNPGWKSLGTFAFLFIVALGNWGIAKDIQTFGEMLTPQNVFSMLVVLGTVGGAWGLKPPTKGANQ